MQPAANTLRQKLNLPENYLPLLAFLTAFVLNLYKLGNIGFWADEGETLILGRFTLHWGLPRIYDEAYHLCGGWGTNANGLYLYHPWLQYYLAALGIFLFGTSVALIRLPFALAGALCVPLLWVLGNKLKVSRRANLVASWLLATNVPFILLNRNVRYYPLPVFFTLLLLIYYFDLRENKLNRWWVISLCSVLLLASMQPVGITVMAVIVLHALIFERRQVVWKYLAAAALFPFACLVGLLLVSWKSILKTASASGLAIMGYHTSINDWMSGFLLHFLNLIKFNFPTMILLVLLIQYLTGKKRFSCSKESLWWLLIMPLSICAVMSFVLNAQIYPGYVATAVPFVVLLAACVIDAVSLNTGLVVILTLLAMNSTILNLPYWSSGKPKLEDKVSFIYAPATVRWPLLRDIFIIHNIDFLLRNYFKELSADYEGPVEGIVKYLRQFASPNETFFATNDQHTIHFMTGLKRVDQIPFETPPTYLIERAGSGWRRGICSGKNSGILDVNEYVSQYLKAHRYEIIKLDYPDFAQENMPVAPFHHRWRSQPYQWARKVIIFRYHPEKSEPDK